MDARRRILLLLGTLVVTAMTAATLLWSRPGPASAEGVAAVSAGGEHTCALTSAGGVKCWGDNRYGQVGDGTSGGFRTAPEDVEGLGSAVAAVSAGGGHTCALTSAGGVKCWGRNDEGQLGNGSSGKNEHSNWPVDVVGLTSGVAVVAAGGFHTCAVTTAGAVKCWGRNDEGQLGDDSNLDSNIPSDVYGLTSGVIKVGAGGKHTCALTDGGGLKCWGDNHVGQLGDGQACDLVACNVPTDVSGLTSGVIKLAVGGEHACARVEGDYLKCWGQNEYGQLAAGWNNPTSYHASPVSACTVPGTPDCAIRLSNVLGVTAGDQHTCAWSTTNRVQCWGFNDKGQLGDGTNRNQPSPRDVCDGPACQGVLSGIEDVSGGGTHTCALTMGGSLLCWGDNSRGQVGIGTTDTDKVNVPVEVPGAKSPVAPTPTRTPTQPAVATPTRTPPVGLFGDVDCDRSVTSIDAAFVLQYDAGLLNWLPCQDAADVNEDGAINAIDAALILQYVAGLIDSLPPRQPWVEHSPGAGESGGHGVPQVTQLVPNR